MGEIEIREVLPGEYEDTGGLTQRAYAEYARPGDVLWDNYFGVLADVAGRAGFATVLVAVAGGRIVGTATVELDRTIDRTGGLQPGQANVRLLAVDPGPGAWRGPAAGRGMRPGRPPGREGDRHAAHHRADGGRAAYLPNAGLPAPICLATLSCIPVWCCKPSGFRSGHWTRESADHAWHPGPGAQVSMAGAACAVTCVTGLVCR